MLSHCDQADPEALFRRGVALSNVDTARARRAAFYLVGVAP
jgi:hypothetical protein